MRVGESGCPRLPIMAVHPPEPNSESALFRSPFLRIKEGYWDSRDSPSGAWTTAQRWANYKSRARARARGGRPDLKEKQHPFMDREWLMLLQIIVIVYKILKITAWSSISNNVNKYSFSNFTLSYQGFWRSAILTLLHHLMLLYVQNSNVVSTNQTTNFFMSFL